MDRKKQERALAGVLGDIETGHLKEAKRALKEEIAKMVDEDNAEMEAAERKANAGGWQKDAMAHERQY